jgi:hypothetical protein
MPNFLDNRIVVDSVAAGIAGRNGSGLSRSDIYIGNGCLRTKTIVFVVVTAVAIPSRESHIGCEGDSEHKN